MLRCLLKNKKLRNSDININNIENMQKSKITDNCRSTSTPDFDCKDSKFQ